MGEAVHSQGDPALVKAGAASPWQREAGSEWSPSLPSPAPTLSPSSSQQPALPSTAKRSPVCYSTPAAPPWADSPTSPGSAAGRGEFCITFSDGSCPSWWPHGLLQVDVLRGAGVFHKLLVELLEGSPGRQDPDDRRGMVEGEVGVLPGTAKPELEGAGWGSTCPTTAQGAPSLPGLYRTAAPIGDSCLGKRAALKSGECCSVQDSCGRVCSWGSRKPTPDCVPHGFCQGFSGVFRHKDVAGKPVVSWVLGDEPKVPAEGQA